MLTCLLVTVKITLFESSIFILVVSILRTKLSGFLSPMYDVRTKLIDRLDQSNYGRYWNGTLRCQGLGC